MTNDRTDGKDINQVSKDSTKEPGNHPVIQMGSMNRAHRRAMRKHTKLFRVYRMEKNPITGKEEQTLVKASKFTKAKSGKGCAGIPKRLRAARDSAKDEFKKYVYKRNGRYLVKKDCPSHLLAYPFNPKDVYLNW